MGDPVVDALAAGGDIAVLHFGIAVRLEIRSSHSCPAAHRHHTATCIFGVAFCGVSPPLRS
nr:hypothetical protein [Actinacidiphila oryziradicis]